MRRLDWVIWACAVCAAVACGDDSSSVTPPPSGQTGASGTAPVVIATAGRSGTAAAPAIAGSGAPPTAGVAALPAAGSGGSRSMAGEAAIDPDADGGVAMLDASMPPEIDSGSERPDAGAPSCPDCCSDGIERGTKGRGARRIVALEPSPEGVAVCPDGRVFVARDASGEVWRVPMDGAAPERWATLGDRRPAGIACDARGRLFVATYASKSGDEISLGATLITGQGATPIELPQPTGGPTISGLNGIVFAQGVGVYASDTANGTILLTQEDAAGSFSTRVVAKDVNSANGLAYDPQKRSLYANASGAGELLSFQVANDGELTARKNVRLSGTLLFMDGVTVDEKGELYVADWLGGRVVQVATGESVASVANPASLAFRGGTLLITDYKLLPPDAEGGLYAVDLGVCGARPAPGAQ